jgi:NodT family efflux transporter outer membrane factor (OMF) lipoprotein
MTNKSIYKSLIGLAFVTLLVLTACNSSKTMVSPEVNTKALFRDSANNSADTITIANIPWKEYFTDAQLQALISEGLEKNYNMQIAYSRIKQAEAGLSMARGAYLPNVSLGVNGSETRISWNKNEGTKVLGYNSASSPVFQLGLTASWEFNLWGKLNSQKRAKYASFLNSYEYRNLIQTNIIAGIAKSYYTLMALDEQLRISKETVELLNKSAETMQALKDAGQTNGAAVEQSKALLYNTQLSVTVLESQIRQQENAICVLIGRGPGSIARSAIVGQTEPARLSYGVPVQMIALRPDVRQAELSLRSAYELTNAAKASLYPTFTISTASIGFANGELANFFKPANIAATIAAGITQPLLYKRQLKGNLNIAKAQQEEALLNFQSVVLTAGQEVSDVLFGYKTSLNKNELRDKQIQALANAVDFTQELLKAGEASYTEVLSAQQGLLSAQLSKVNDRLEQLTYSVSLYKALGGGTK